MPQAPFDPISHDRGPDRFRHDESDARVATATFQMNHYVPASPPAPPAYCRGEITALAHPDLARQHQFKPTAWRDPGAGEPTQSHVRHGYACGAGIRVYAHGGGYSVETYACSRQ